MLGVPWNKLTDNLSNSIPKFQQTVTKRIILTGLLHQAAIYVASIYDPLAIIFPCHALRKVNIANFVMRKPYRMQKFLSILKKIL